MNFKISLLISLVFGLIPSYVLYVAIYSFTHSSAVWMFTRSWSGNYNTGISLKLIGLGGLILYSLIFSYMSHKFSKNKSLFNKNVWVAGILSTLIYLPLVAFLNSGSNPW